MNRDEIVAELKKHLQRGMLSETDMIKVEVANAFLRRVNPAALTTFKFDGQTVMVSQVIVLAGLNKAVK